MRVESIYWFIVLIFFVFLLHKYRSGAVFVLILLFYFEGLFTFYGKTAWNAYKILLPVYALYVVIKQQRHIILSVQEKRILTAFALFSSVFFISCYINNDDLLLVLNQYSRYLLAMMTYLLFKASLNKGIDFSTFNDFLLVILKTQIILSVLNFFLMGIHENIVGSISSNGGSAATIIPVLGFTFIWLSSGGKTGKAEWIFLALLIFIGFVSMKRAVWILVPFIVLLLTYYVPKKKVSRNLLLVIFLLPLIFYVGVRINPTLNPNKKMWGKFDLEYFIDYSKSYNFGDDSNSEVKVGRGGATLLTLEAIFSSGEYKPLFGAGLSNVYAWNEDIVENPELPIKVSQINSITMATGIFQNYYTGGISLVLTFLIFMYLLISIVNHNRFRNFLFIVFLWEYLLYSNAMIRTPALSALLIYIILFSNYHFKIKNISTSVQTGNVNSIS